MMMFIKSSLSFNFVFILSLLNSNQAQDNDSSKQDVQVPKIFDYGYYVSKYGKAYSPLETMVKSKLFYSRTMKIFQHNILYANKDVSYYLKQNQFTDLTPAELKDQNGPDLTPVLGADKYPDMPADKAMILEQHLEDIEEESNSVIDQSGETKVTYNDDKQKHETILNVFSTPDVDVKELIKTLKKEPSLAKRMASIVELGDSPEEAKIKESKKKMRKLRNRRRIVYSPVVNSNNDNYDMQLVSSYGIFSDLKNKIEENYAERMMKGFELDFDSDPFSGAAFFGDEYALGAIDHPPITISNLIQSAKFLIETIKKANLDANELERKKLDNDESLNGIKYHIDWRRTGCITAPKAQMSCDSCYAFSVLSMMEFFHCAQTKRLTDFSAQYIVDCGQKAELKGCRGGKITNVGLFIKQHGIELNSMYPYNGQENECPYDKEVDEKKKNGYLRPEITHWHNFQEMGAWQKWLARSPLIVGINMPADFPAYGGGVHTGEDCIEGKTHAMLLVGSGVENNRKFWLLKNSYSESWGESGYFRLAQDAPLKCFNSAFVVRVNFLPKSSA